MAGACEIRLRAHPLAVDHLARVLGASYAPHRDWQEWTEVLRVPRSLYVWEEELVQLLHEAVIMQPPEGVTVSMALDCI